MLIRLGRLPVILLVTAWLVFAPAAAQAGSAPQLAAASAVLMDMRTGTVLYAKAAHVRRIPASITKILTAMLVIEHGHLGRRVTVPLAAVGTPGSSVYLEPGQRLTIRDLLYGMMLVSGNDAAVALSILTAGSERRFVALMNRTVRLRGLRNTHFVNPDGLPDPRHYTSAYDQAVIARAAMRLARLRRIVRTRSFVFPGATGPVELYNEDKLLWRYPGTIGVKTGYTIEGGETLVTAVRRGDTTLLSVLLQDTPQGLWTDPVKLMNWGFSHFRDQELVRAGQVMGVAPVDDGHRRVKLVALSSLWQVVRRHRPDPRQERFIPLAPLTGSVLKGQLLGRVEVVADGHLAGSVPVTAATSVLVPPGGPSPWLVALAALGLLVAAVLRELGLRRRRRRRWALR